jgi:hypothetical protein
MTVVRLSVLVWVKINNMPVKVLEMPFYYTSSQHHIDNSLSAVTDPILTALEGR